MIKTDIQAWHNCNPLHRWVFNKLEVALAHGLQAAPASVPVPEPNWYIVRPIYNLEGMGLDARLMWMEPDETHDLNPSEFWCEYLNGRHFSVDFKAGKPVLCVEGIKRNTNDPYTFWKWDKWIKLDVSEAPVPSFWPFDLSFFYTINVEFIGDTPIEIHLRPNPNFQGHNYTELVPIWDDEWSIGKLDQHPSNGWHFVDKPDYTLPIKRLGFFGK